MGKWPTFLHYSIFQHTLYAPNFCVVSPRISILRPLEFHTGTGHLGPRESYISSIQWGYPYMVGSLWGILLKWMLYPMGWFSRDWNPESLLIIMGKSMASGFNFPVKTNPLNHVILMCPSPLYYLQSNCFLLHLRQNFASLERVAVCNHGTQ